MTLVIFRTILVGLFETTYGSLAEDGVLRRFSFSAIVRIVVLPIWNYLWWVKFLYQIYKVDIRE